MLDLKAKLASAGLVSQEDVARVERDKKRSQRRGPKSKEGSRFAGLAVQELRGKPKSTIYDGVRRWVDSARLDAANHVPTDTSVVYHFPQATGRIGKLRLEPQVIKQLEQGQAGLIAYMSNQGLAHAVVPADGARGVAELYPLWLRVLVGDARAGQVAPKDKASS